MRTYLRNIYLADDDRDDVDFFEYTLMKICPECKLTIAHNGEELVNKLQNVTIPPDLVFIDINMPLLSGLEALEKIKEFNFIKTTPIIVYSTSANEADVRKALEIGATSYVVKPPDIDKLSNLIEKILSLDWQSYVTPIDINEFILKA